MTANVPAKAPVKTVYEKKKCVACDNEIPACEKVCPICRSPANGTECKNCWKRIPEGALFCTKCNEYQSKRKYLQASTTGFTLVLAFFAVFSGVFSAGTYVSDRNSDTKVMVTSADSKVLHLKVWNTGRKPSRLVDYRLKFPSELMVENTALDQAEGDAVIEPGRPVSVSLTVKELSRSLKPGGKEHFTKDDIKSFLDKSGRLVTSQLEVDVEESGHLWQLSSQPFVIQRSDTLPTDRMKEFILGRIPDVDVR